MNLSTLPALGLRLSLLPIPDPDPDHDEDDNNYDRQNYADRGTARDRGIAPEGVMVGEGWGGEQRHQGGGRGQGQDQSNGKRPAHGGTVLHFRLRRGGNKVTLEMIGTGIRAMQGSSNARPNVRLWLIADISKDRELGPLYPRKRTFARQSKKVCL